MGNHGKKFFTKSLANEKFAARVYDRFVIQRHGLKAVTNFSYKAKMVKQIVKDIKADMTRS